MTRARGQSSRTMSDREYPRQVLVLAKSVGGKTLDKVIAFHAKLGIPTTSRSVRKNDTWYTLYCFAYEDDAHAFKTKFGGELLSQSKD
jgi:hypothetical protein